MRVAPTLPRSFKLYFSFLQAAAPCCSKSMEGLQLTKAKDGRSIYRDFYLLVDTSELAPRLCQVWEKEAPCCSAHSFDSPWSSWLPAQECCLWLKALLGQLATKAFVGVAELQMISRAFINSAFAPLKRPRSISSSSFSTSMLQLLGWEVTLETFATQLWASLSAHMLSLSVIPGDEHCVTSLAITKTLPRRFPVENNEFICHFLTASAVRAPVKKEYF